MSNLSARFAYLKSKVSIFEVYERLTGKCVAPDGMVCCIIHNDRSPSMKFSQQHNGCRCFGLCDKWFDPIGLWGAFNNLRPFAALVELEKLYGVVWDGTSESAAWSEDELSPFGALSAELLSLAQSGILPERDRLRLRRDYWEARQTRDVPALVNILGRKLADPIIAKWGEEND